MKANSTSYFGCSVLQSQKPISQRRTNMSEKNTPTEDPKAKNDTPATQHEEPVAPAQETNEIQEQPIDDTDAIAGQSGDTVGSNEHNAVEPVSGDDMTEETEILTSVDATPSDVKAAFTLLKNTHLKDGDVPLKQRKKLLKSLKKQLASSREKIVSVLKQDYSERSEFQTMMVDYFEPMSAIKSTLQQIDDWVEPDNVDSFWLFWPSKSQIKYCAKGVVAIISPWNYPFYLSLMPLIGAIAAGNRVILKPSELSPHSARVLEGLLKNVFPNDILQVVQGGVETSAAVTSLPLDHIFFTGSTEVGKKVMAAASANLVPVTLELGGKSPAVIHPGYPLKKALTKILNGKMINAGQSCFSPDYILCSKGTEGEIEPLVEQIQGRLFPTIQNNSDYSSTISEAHFLRLKQLVEDAKEKGARVVEINPSRESSSSKFPLHLIFNPTDEMQVMKEEIFGPILPVVTYNNVDDIFDYINTRPTPLCAYYFDSNKKRINAFTDRIRAGGITVNGTYLHIAQHNMPFSGLGSSGMGSYHGWFTFQTFSHQKSVFQNSPISPIPYALGAPYKSWAQKLLRFFAWW